MSDAAILPMMTSLWNTVQTPMTIPEKANNKTGVNIAPPNL